MGEISAWSYPQWLQKRLYPFWEAPRYDCLRALILGEAEGEPFLGMFAVGCVVRNRVDQCFRGHTYQEVALWRHQFSCFYADWEKRQKVMLKSLGAPAGEFPQASEAARCILRGDPDVTGGATFYCNPRGCDPPWLPQAVKTATAGRHDFFIWA